MYNISGNLIPKYCTLSTVLSRCSSFSKVDARIKFQKEQYLIYADLQSQEFPFCLFYIIIMFIYWLVLRWDFNMQPRLASNLWSSCLSFPSAGITDRQYHFQPWSFLQAQNLLRCYGIFSVHPDFPNSNIICVTVVQLAK